MKIVCLNPPFKTEYGRYSRTSRSPAITKSGTLYYPIWLSYVAGILEAAGHRVNLIDSCAYEYDLRKTLLLIAELMPEIVIIDTSTPSIYVDVNTVEEIKKLLPHCFVVMMGTHPTALPRETMDLNAAIDMCVLGEADHTVRELVQKLSGGILHEIMLNAQIKRDCLETINGIAFRDGSRVCVNPPRELIKDLDGLPFVSSVYKKFLDPRKYFFAASDYPEVQIMTARGCIARCTFCAYPQIMHGGKYRVRSPRNVADEFQWIVENMPEVREIGIEDDVFTGDQRRVVEFCKEVIDREIKIKWYCNVRVDLTLETMQWMKKAGCVLVTVGYESGNNNILQNIDKRATAELNKLFSMNCAKAGLLVHGCFMVGNRGETRDTLKQTLNLALEFSDDTIQFFPLIVYPGTKDYEWAKKEGLLTVSNYSEYLTKDGNHNSVVKMYDMSSDEIREWCNYARRKYYLRPRYLGYKVLRLLENPSDIRRTFKSAQRFVRHLLSL